MGARCAAAGTELPASCAGADLWICHGSPQQSAQHLQRQAPITLAADGLLPRFWRRVLAEGPAAGFDAVLNLAYDWLPLWLTPTTSLPLFHLVSMGSVGEAMDQAIAELAARGVTFARFDGVPQDDAGVWTAPDGTGVAWFHDPAGNLLSLTQTPTSSPVVRA